MLFVVVFLPISFLILTFLLGRRLGSFGVLILSVLVSLAQFTASIFLYLETFIFKGVICYEFFSFLSVESYVFSVSFLVDRLASAMLVIITCISLAVQLYSCAYMRDDPHRARFSSYLQLFTFFMIFLVLSPSYFQLFLGWEGVGLTSYLLVNFWYTRTQANKSGLKALLVNRVGDYFYMFALIFMLFFYKTSNLVVLNSVVDVSQEVDFICFLFVLAAAAKSAQLGLHTWLPDAMEGPTPVSALIHAATMVTAGIFLLLRASTLLSFSVSVSSFLLVLGSLTAFFAASVGATQYDLKKIIAYSTCSQLGYMAAAAGAGAYDVCFYHLVNHAFFKALLFLTAGVVIHSILNDQDLRRYGGLIRLLPYSYLMMLVGSLAITGFPFLSGYYSKEGLLETLLSQGQYFSYGCLTLTAFITAYYSFRSLYLVFGGTPRFSLSQSSHLADAEWLFFLPLSLLAALTVLHGYVSRDLYIGLGNLMFSDLLYSPIVAAEFGLTLSQKLIPLVFSVAGASLGYLVFRLALADYSDSLYFFRLVRFFNKRWWFDLLDTYLVRQTLLASLNLYRVVERGYNEQIGERAVVGFLKRLIDRVYRFHNGHIYFIFIIFMVSLFLIFLASSFTFILPLSYGFYLPKKRL